MTTDITIKTTPTRGNVPAAGQRRIASLVTAAIDAMHASSPRARARRVYDDGNVLRCAVVAWHMRQDDDVQVRAHEWGGFVPNSYGYTANSDYVEVVIAETADRSVVRVSVSASRRRAPSRSGGDGETMLCRLLREGQTLGRIIEPA